MTSPSQFLITRFLRRVHCPPPAGGLNDAQLLERFVAQRDESAFEVLMWRHGPMVLEVCCRILRHEQDAEDAFQATFLVLVRKAGSIGKRESLGSWLYRVGFRVALRAKVLAKKRGASRMRVLDVLGAEPAPDPVWKDLRPVLDEEVNRLPEKYRRPFVLCYLDGKTNAEAARELGCPKGTVLSRLAWARERLRARLTRRGLALSAGVLAALPGRTVAAAVVPAALVDSTRNAAMLVAGGKAAAGIVSGQVAALTKGVLQTMMWNKIKIITACVLAVSALGIGGGLLARQTRGAKGTPGQSAERTEPKSDKPADKAEKSKAEEKTYQFEFRNKPWSNVLEWLGEQAGLPVILSSLPTGTFTFIPPRIKPKYTLGEIIDILNEELLNQKYILIRREATFTLRPADEKIDPSLLSRVRLDELEKRGKTELVTVVVPLTVMKAKDLGPDVKKMIGAFGDVVILEKFNQLILQDMAANLLRIHQAIKDLEARESEKKP